MVNDYYNDTGNPGTGASGSSAIVRAEFDAIQAGFDKLPSLSTKNNQIVHVNPGSTALVSSSGLTFDGTTLALTGALTVSTNLTVNGNATLGNAVTDTHQVNGQLLIGDDGTNLILTRTGGGDSVHMLASAAGSGGVISALNAAATDYEPFTINAETLTVSARSGAGAVATVALFSNAATALTGTLSVTGNVTLGDAVGDNHDVTGAVNITDDGVALQLIRASGGDRLRVSPQTAGNGTFIESYNNGVTDYRTLELDCEALTVAARNGVGTVATVAVFSNAATALTGTLSVSGNVTLGDAVGDGHVINGNVSHTMTAGSIAYRVSGASGGDKLTFTAHIAGSGGGIDIFNSAETDYEPLTVSAEYVALRARTGAGTVAETARISALGLGVFCTPVDEFEVSKSKSGSELTSVLRNTSTDANSAARYVIATNGATAGDPFLLFFVTGVREWALGIDNSDSDKFKVSMSTALGTNDFLTIDTSGTVTFFPSNGLYTSVNTASVAGAANGTGGWAVRDSAGALLGAVRRAGGSGELLQFMASHSSMTVMSIGGEAVGAVQSIRFYTDNSIEQFRVAHTASAVNYVEVRGNSTGNPPIIQANGTDTNIVLAISSKGTESVSFYTNSTNQLQFRVAHVASAVNFLQVQGNVTGDAPTISAQGSDTNVSLNLASKGTGGIAFFTNVSVRQLQIAHTASAVNYVQVTGSITGEAVNISAQGSDTNVGVDIRSKGNKNVSVSTNTSVVQVSVEHTASANRYITLTGSNGGNPTIGVSAGSLLITTPAADDVVLTLRNPAAATPNGLYIQFSAASPDNNSQYALRFEDSTAVRCTILSDGDLQNHDNSYGAISDLRLKTNIVDAGSQLSDFRRYKFRNYEFISDVEAGKRHRQIGLIAQEVLMVSPGLVKQGADGMYGLEYSVLAVKAARAVQELVLRTDDHETRIAELEADNGRLRNMVAELRRAA